MLFTHRLKKIITIEWKRLQVSDKKKGIALRTVCKRVKDPIEDSPFSKKYSYHKNYSVSLKDRQLKIKKMPTEICTKKNPINKIIRIIKKPLTFPSKNSFSPFLKLAIVVA